MEKSVAELKRQIRKEIKKLKELVPDEDKLSKSYAIFSEVEKLDVFKSSETLLLYWSMPDEVNTHDFILKWTQTKRILLPVIHDEYLALKQFSGINNMIIGSGIGIPEPKGPFFDKYDEIDLIIVPGVAFDKNNNRLGHGKAYYDKLLPKVNAYKLGVCFDFQLLDNIPATSLDVKIDKIISL